jgi:Peptidase family M28
MREKCIIPPAEVCVMKRWAGGLVGAWFFLAAVASAQTITARVDGAAAHRDVTTLASPEWQGRRTMTPGFDHAADWAADRLREWKLQPAGESGTFFQTVPIVGSRADLTWATGMPALVIDGRAFSFKEGEFVVDQASTPATDVTAEAVFVGYGISAPDRGLDEYAGIDVTGKVVFVLRGSPKDAPPDLTDFPPDPPAAQGPPEGWAAESTDEAKVMTAYRKGAAAIVLSDADPESRRAQPWPASKPHASPFTRKFVVIASMDPRILRALMLRDEHESLVGYVDRINRLRRSVQQKKPQTRATAVRVRVKGYDEVALYGESFGNNRSRNVLAKIEGTDPVLKRQAVVIGAHLDHLGFRRGLLHPGADDNASGSAVVLEVARTLAASQFRPRRTIVFALWCGEENGHFGSRQFTASPTDGLTMERVVGYINMDMVGLGTKIDANGARDFPVLFSLMMRDQLPDVARLVRPDVSGPGGSDYAPFLAHGVDAVALLTSGGEGHPDYHDSADTPEKIQPALLASVGQFVMQAAANLANDTATPLPVPGRGEVCDRLRFVVPDMVGQTEDGWRHLAARTPDQVETAALAAARQAGRNEESGTGATSADSPWRVLSGVSARAVAGDVAVLGGAAVALGVGRLDVEGADGLWVQGGLTPAGKAAMKAVERSGVTVNLIRPTAVLAADVLETATRPILVSGMTAPDADLAKRAAERGGVFALECPAESAAACASSLHALRKALGGSANLLVSMPAPATPDRLAAASRALYHELAQRGWTKDEIYAVAGLTPDGEPGGNLARLVAK